MRWTEKSRRPEYLQEIPCLHAKEIVYDAYKEGYITWNTFTDVSQKIDTAKNDSWMFEQKQNT